MATRATSSDSTRERLLAAALQLFAEHGVEAVSLRAVTAAASAANQSAVHYHFRDKAGLLAALLVDVNRRLAPLQAEALAELSGILRRRRPGVREIVAIGFAPFVQLFLDGPEGKRAIKLLSRLTWESGRDAQGLLVKMVQPYFLELEALFARTLARKPPEVLAFHVYVAVNNLIHGLADATLLQADRRPGVNALLRQRPDELLNHFFDYIAAGIAAA